MDKKNVKAERERILADAESYIVYIDQALNEHAERFPRVCRLRRSRGNGLGPATGTKRS